MSILGMKGSPKEHLEVLIYTLRSKSKNEEVFSGAINVWERDTIVDNILEFHKKFVTCKDMPCLCRTVVTRADGFQTTLVVDMYDGIQPL